jgi:hypothetical protein
MCIQGKPRLRLKRRLQIMDREAKINERHPEGATLGNERHNRKIGKAKYIPGAKIRRSCLKEGKKRRVEYIRRSHRASPKSEKE